LATCSNFLLVLWGHQVYFVSILKHIIIACEGSFRLINLLGFPSFFFKISFLWSVGLVEHDLFLCPLVTHFGFWYLGSNFGPFPLFLISHFVGCFILWSLLGFAHNQERHKKASLKCMRQSSLGLFCISPYLWVVFQKQNIAYDPLIIYM
jgi:hypothetical protein